MAFFFNVIVYLIIKGALTLKSFDRQSRRGCLDTQDVRWSRRPGILTVRTSGCLDSQGVLTVKTWGVLTVRTSGCLDTQDVACLDSQDVGGL
eukprot:154319-Amorphochlora_amoeboformis.AAC.1